VHSAGTDIMLWHPGSSSNNREMLRHQHQKRGGLGGIVRETVRSVRRMYGLCVDVLISQGPAGEEVAACDDALLLRSPAYTHSCTRPVRGSALSYTRR
jgi:hypothetical protein